MAPISVAAYEGHAECVELLLSLGARLDILDRDDKSALFHAAEQAQPEVVEVGGGGIPHLVGLYSMGKHKERDVVTCQTGWTDFDFQIII